MGFVRIAPASRVYVDANILIYHLEGLEEFRPALTRLIDLVTNDNVSLLTSDLSLSEALVPAWRAADSDRAKIYIDFFEAQEFAELNVARN